MQFVIPVPVPKVWEWVEPFPFPFPNVNKSFPLTPGPDGPCSVMLLTPQDARVQEDELSMKDPVCPSTHFS